MRVINHRIDTTDLTYAELLDKLCEEYKDGYVEPVKPPKEKKQWQIDQEIFMKAIQDKEVFGPDGEVKPQFQKYLL